MQSAAKHIRLFRAVYNLPPCSYIFGCIMICIRDIATIFATKVFAFSFTNVKAVIAHLRSISRRNSKEPNSIQLSLIGQILAKLIKAPAVQFCLLCFAFWLCCPANITQIFNSYAFIFGFCFCNNLFAYGMIVYRNEPALSAAKPFQEPFSSLSAFALNACPLAYFLRTFLSSSEL